MDKRYVYWADVTRIVDGDTIDANVDLGFNVFHKIRFRLNGIDTMELRDPDPVKREHAQRARDRLTELLMGCKILIETRKTDKYGRYLADIYLGDLHVNQQMITEGLAVPYMV